MLQDTTALGLAARNGHILKRKVRLRKAVKNRIIPFSSVDGPETGQPFLQELNIDCKYCHNPETRKLCVQCAPGQNSSPAACLWEQMEK